MTLVFRQISQREEPVPFDILDDVARILMELLEIMSELDGSRTGGKCLW